MEWAVAFVILIIIEIATVNLVSIWFAIGALAAYVTSCLTDSVIMQVLVFIVISVITLIITKPLAKKFVKPNSDAKKMNTLRIIGKIGIVTRPIAKDLDGEVKVDGKFWTAIADSDIEKGTKIEVQELKGIKLVVKKKEEND